MVRKKHYAFLDIVIDVLYSITLYNLFTYFPGFGDIPSLGIFIFTAVIMINYWWSSRSISDMPRHYMIDVYFFVFIMFIFTKMTEFIKEGHMFIFWLTMLFFVDLMYSVVDIKIEKYNKKWKEYLHHYLLWNGILTAVYVACFLMIKEMTIPSVILIILPYAIYLVIYRHKGLLKTWLEYEG